MEYDELELDTLGDQKTALFVILSDTDSTFNFVAALMYDSTNTFGTILLRLMRADCERKT